MELLFRQMKTTEAASSFTRGISFPVLLVSEDRREMREREEDEKQEQEQGKGSSVSALTPISMKRKLLLTRKLRLLVSFFLLFRLGLSLQGRQHFGLSHGKLRRRRHSSQLPFR